MDTLTLRQETAADLDAARERVERRAREARQAARRAARVEREKARRGLHSCDLGQGILFPADCRELVDLFNCQSGARKD